MILISIRKIICLTLSFMVVLLIVRVRVLDIKFSALTLNYKVIQQVIMASYYDWMFAVLMGAFFVLLIVFARKHKNFLHLIFVGFVIMLAFCIMFALLNNIAVHLLKGPLNYQWVYYSDFFGNSGARTGFLSYLSGPLWRNFFILSFAAFAGCFILYYLSLKLEDGKQLGLALIILCVLLTTYFIEAGNFFKKNNKTYNKLANPVVFFVKSVFVSFKDPNKLFAIEFPKKFYAVSVPQKTKKTTHHILNLKIRNVIIYVLESVPAEYVSGYGSKYSVTPNIEGQLKHSIVFSDIYAHFPATNSSMVSLLTSMYPMFSYKCVSKEYPYISWPSISSELKGSHYRTAFFHASDNRFQKMDKFLSMRKFDKIADYRDIQCNKNILVGSTPTWKYLDGIDEECMVDTFMEWLSKDKKEVPFFAMLWTIQTHHPYFSRGKEIIYVKENVDHNRYLNALHYSDAILGKLLNELQKRKMMESTLVVIVGDHGEAFGRHDQVGHGAEIYEENVKVPLIFINPLLKESKISVIGGQVDLAPTIMDILGSPSPVEWEGLSLFDASRINRTYFFNPHSCFLFGYREGKYKIIYNANWNETMIYDLSIDPDETNNIAEQMPDLVETSAKLLGGWVQSHSAVLNEKIARMKAKERSASLLIR